MQYNRINCFSKMIVFIATLFIVQLCSNNICYATSPITFSEYIKTDDFKTKVRYGHGAWRLYLPHARPQQQIQKQDLPLRAGYRHSVS